MIGKPGRRRDQSAFEIILTWFCLVIIKMNPTGKSSAFSKVTQIEILLCRMPILRMISGSVNDPGEKRSSWVMPAR